MARPQIHIESSMVLPDRLPDFDHDAFLYVYRVDGCKVTAVHWSGRFDGDVEELAAWLLHLAKKYKADYITTTETQQKGALKLLREAFGPEWGVRKTSQYVLIFDREIFKAIPRLTPHTVVTTKIRNWAQWRQMHVGIFNIRHRELKRRWRILVIHGPSGIEAGRKPKPGKQWDIAKTGWPKVGRNLRRFAMLHRRAVQVTVGDANANHRLEYWLNLFEGWLQSRSVWRGRVPNRGTHRGGRLIDGAWIWGAK